jgi:hypothetical protein
VSSRLLTFQISAAANALNSSPVLGLNNTYGVTTGQLTGTSWQVPQGILPARVIKIGVQANF